MMTLTVSELDPRLQAIVGEVEREGRVVEVERDGQVVARIVPVAPPRPWEAMHGKGRLLASPEESVLRDEDFEANR